MNPPRRENADELRARCEELLRNFNRKCRENDALCAKLDVAKSALTDFAIFGESYSLTDLPAETIICIGRQCKPFPDEGISIHNLPEIRADYQTTLEKFVEAHNAMKIIEGSDGK